MCACKSSLSIAQADLSGRTDHSCRIADNAYAQGLSHLIHHSEAKEYSYSFFISEVQPKFQTIAKGEGELDLLFAEDVVERAIDLAWERDSATAFFTPPVPGGANVAPMVTDFLDDQDNRDYFIRKVTNTLRWYVCEAAALFRTSLQPDFWDLSFTGDKFTVWPDQELTTDLAWTCQECNQINPMAIKSCELCTTYRYSESIPVRFPPHPPLEDLLEEEDDGVIVKWDVPRAPRSSVRGVSVQDTIPAVAATQSRHARAFGGPLPTDGAEDGVHPALQSGDNPVVRAVIAPGRPLLNLLGDP